ncbi:MAG: nicotinate-nucleotide adenylyltransferase [Gemmatimonadales bacterium]
MRIGVFGGSFDPIHHGHLIVARAALEGLSLDQVRFVPVRQQPFKQGDHGASPEDRLAMLAVAVAGEPGFVVDRCELDRPGPSYTVDTLRTLRAAYPRDQLVLLLGADAARDLATWREAEVLPTLAEIVVLSRPGAATVAQGLVAATLAVPPVAIAAADLRARCARGASIRHCVPDAVRALIADRRLYRERD